MDEFVPGKYEILEKTYLRKGKNLESEKVKKLKKGKKIKIAEIVIIENRVRGSLSKGSGWLTLKKLESGKVFVKLIPKKETSVAPEPTKSKLTKTVGKAEKKQEKFWKCEFCRKKNFLWKETCYKCKRKPRGARGRLWICKCGQNNDTVKNVKCQSCHGEQVNITKRAEMWICKKCFLENVSIDEYCQNCCVHKSGKGVSIELRWEKKNLRNKRG